MRVVSVALNRGELSILLLSLFLVNCTHGRVAANQIVVTRAISRAALADAVTVNNRLVFARFATLPAVNVTRLDMPSQPYTLRQTWSSHGEAALFRDAMRKMRCGNVWRTRSIPKQYRGSALGQWTILVNNRCTLSRIVRGSKVMLEEVQLNDSSLGFTTRIYVRLRM